MLWYLRLAASRNLAQAWVLAGHIRINGRRTDKPGHAVKAGDVLTLPMRLGVNVIEITTLPIRRGPALEAQSCYRVLDGSAANLIADVQPILSTGDPIP